MPQFAPVKHVEICLEPEYALNDPYPSLAPHSLRKLLLPTIASAPTIVQTEQTSHLPTSSPFRHTYTQTAPIKRSLLGESSTTAQSLRRKLIHGTNVLIVQGGTVDKLPIYHRLYSLGVNVYILDTPTSCWKNSSQHTCSEFPESPVKCFIPLSYSNDGDYSTRAVEALRACEEVNTITFHGVITYFEDAVAFAARIADALGVPGADIEACDRARSKYRTRQCMREAGLPTPRFTLLTDESDILDAIEEVGFPAVLKPAFGAASVGVSRVNNEAELRKSFAKLKNFIECDDDPIWLQGTEIVYEEYYDGDEFDIDVLMCEGKAVYAKVSDNWAVLEPYFQETGMHSPSSYAPSKQKELIKLSVDSINAIGFINGCLHVECRYTSKGEARIIEVNGRMGGDPVYDFNKLVWGVDLVEEHYMSIVGIPINPVIAPKPKCYVGEFAFNSPCSGVLMDDCWLDILKGDERVYRLKYFKKKGDKVIGPEGGVPDWVAEIIIIGYNSQDEVNNLIKIIVKQKVRVQIMKNGHNKADKLAFYFPGHVYPFA